MSELDPYVSIVISRETTTPSQTGFGVPLILAKFLTSISTDLVLEYTDAADMLTDGFTSYHPAYLASLKEFSQSPRPEKVLIGQQTNAQAKTVQITPIAINSTVYIVTLESTAGQTIYQYTSDVSATVAEIIAGLDAAIDAAAWAATTAYAIEDHVTNDSGKVYRCTVAGTSAASGGPTGTGSAIVDGTVTWTYVGVDHNLTLTDNTTYATIAADGVDDWFNIEVNNRALITQENVTANGSPNGVAEDIAAIQVINDDWYFLVVTDQGQPVVEVAAATVNALTKLAIYTSADDDQYDSTSTTDVMAVLNTAAYDRIIPVYHHKSSTQYCGSAWIGKNAPHVPGSITWMFKNLVGVDYSTFSSAEVTALKNKKGNMYVRKAGVNFMQFGTVASGEFIDIMRGTDFIHARMQEFIFALMVRVGKIPLTDLGITAVASEMLSALKLGVDSTLFKADPYPTVTPPKASAISTIDRGNRLMPNFKFYAEFAGAAHKIGIRGVVAL